MRDERLRMALSFHPLFIGGDPFHVTSMYILVSYLEKAFGVHYAMGGSSALASAMAGVIERLERFYRERKVQPYAPYEASRLGGDALAEHTTFWQRLRDHQLDFFAREQTLWRLSLAGATPPSR